MNAGTASRSARTRPGATALLACLAWLAGCSDADRAPVRTVADTQAASAASIATRPAPIDLEGAWVAAGDDDRLQVVGDKPQFTAAGRKLFEAHRTAAAKGDRSWDGTRRCLPPGMPRLLAIAQPFEIAVDAHLLLMSFQLQRLVRLVYLDDAFPADRDASFLGESHGHWEDRALLVDTQNFKPGLVLDGTGLPAGTRLRLAERIELQDDGLLVDHLTIADDEMYQRPWQAELRFRRSTQLPREDVCAERTAQRP